MREILFRAKAINRDTDREYRTNYKNGDWVYGLITKPYNEEYDFPAADVQPVKHGNWVQIGEQSAKCTECGGVLKSNGIDKTGKALIFNAVYHYCPNCGADMRGDTNG